MIKNSFGSGLGLKCAPVASIASVAFLGVITLGVIAQAGPPDVQIKARLLKDTKTQKLELMPPDGHHFNLDGPNNVWIDTVPVTLTKSAKEIDANLEAPKKDCLIKLHLFVCDDKGTYCMPVRKELKCQEIGS